MSSARVQSYLIAYESVKSLGTERAINYNNVSREVSMIKTHIFKGRFNSISVNIIVM